VVCGGGGTHGGVHCALGANGVCVVVVVVGGGGTGRAFVGTHVARAVHKRALASLDRQAGSAACAAAMAVCVSAAPASATSQILSRVAGSVHMGWQGKASQGKRSAHGAGEAEWGGGREQASRWARCQSAGSAWGPDNP
jgi:hypothetical protein